MSALKFRCACGWLAAAIFATGGVYRGFEMQNKATMAVYGLGVICSLLNLMATILSQQDTP